MQRRTQAFLELQSAPREERKRPRNVQASGGAPEARARGHGVSSSLRRAGQAPLLAGRALAEMEMEHHTRGSLVWVNDSQAGWVKGEVVGLEGSKLRVRTETGVTRLCSPADCPLQNPSSRMGVEVRLCGMQALAGVALGLCGRPRGLHLARGGLGRARTCALRAPQHLTAAVKMS